MKSILLSACLCLFLYCTQAQQFTAGNIAVIQADASASNTTCSIIELNPAMVGQTTGVTSVPIIGTGTSALRFSGSATSTCYLANSNDGTLLCFTGGDTTNTSVNINTVFMRSVGTLNNAQTFNVAATYKGSSGNQTRCATSLNNTNWYIGDQNGLYTNNTASASPGGSSNNFRGVKSFGGVVYGLQQSASVAVVGTLSALTGGTYTGLPGLVANNSAQDFYLVSSGSNGAAYDILYIDTSTVATGGGILKYSLVSGAWVANGSYKTGFAGFGFAAKANGTGADLYISTGNGATIANNVIKLTDAAGYNSTIAITTANNVILYTAPTGKTVKGVAFAPLPAPSLVAMPNIQNFGTILFGNFSAGQKIALSAAALNPAGGTLAVTAPSTDFQISNDSITWTASSTIAYSGNGSTTGSFFIRFSPQTAGAKMGNVTVSGGGLTNPVAIAVSGMGDNNLSFTSSASTTIALNPPYVSGTNNDPNDPSLVSGIVMDVKNSGVAIPAANYTVTASSSNTAVVPNGNSNLIITQTDGSATIKINPVGIGYSTITLTLTQGTDTKNYVINYAASQSVKTTTTWLTGMADASSAIALDDNYMVVVDDENNFLYVYNRTQPGLPAKMFDFNPNNILNLTDGNPLKELDLEASSRGVSDPSRMYFLGSMSNSSSFNYKPNRDRLFAETVAGTGAATSFTYVGYDTLRTQLIAWGDANGYNFSASAAEGVDPKTTNGFNIEGMCFAPDNTTMYIGFRAPLVPTATRTNAVIAPIQNFESWFNSGLGVTPTIGAPIELNLGGRGIRELYRLSNGVLVIVAGSSDGTSNPAIYTWSGVATDAPVIQPSFNVTGINAEGVLGVNENGQLSANKLQIIADNGSMVYYNDGVQAKDLTNSNFSKFSSDIVVSSSTVLPIALNYFTATKNGTDVLLNWQTASADDGVAFDILRSTNGQDFITIQTVAAVTAKNSYAFTDVSAPAGTLYYRISTISADGQKLLSAIRIINANGAAPLVKIYPNPVVNNVFSVETNTIGNKKLGVYNSDGVLYKYYEYAGTTKDIYTNAWPRGTYMLRIIPSDGTVVPIQKIEVL